MSHLEPDHAPEPLTDPGTEPDPRYSPDGQPLDPRAIARASLAAGRNASLWVVAVGVLVSTVVAFAVDTPTGALVLASLLAVCAVLRVAVRGPGPAALVVRRRAVDTATLLLLAIGVGVLSQIIPSGR